MRKMIELSSRFIIAFLLIATVCSDAAKKIAYIYQDLGAGVVSSVHAKKMLEEVLGNRYEIREINSQEIIQGAWKENAVLLFMPGGRSSGYAKKLDGEGNKQIRQFVENGGAYLGICAGAYYGGSKVEFDKSAEHGYVFTRELSFYNGVIEGPTFYPFSYGSYEGASATPIVLPDGKKLTVYYKGGCNFLEHEKCENVEILACYENDKVAIVKMPFGSGIVILSGVHFEIDPNFLINDAPEDGEPFLEPIIPELMNDDTERIAFCSYILGELGIASEDDDHDCECQDTDAQDK